MTRPIVIDVIGRDRTGAAMASAAASQKALAKEIDSTNRHSDNLRKSQLGLIAAQERYNKVSKDTGASVGQLATAQKGLITAQQRVSAETKKMTAETEKFGNTAKTASGKFSPLLDTALLLGPAIVPIGAAAVAAGAGLAGLGAAGLLAFKGIQTEMKNSTALGVKYQATFAPVVDEFHQLEHIAAANVFGGINQGVAQARTLFPLVNQDIAMLSTHLGDIAGHTGAGLVALFHQLNPLFLEMAKFLDAGSASFQQWATTSTGPAKFVVFAQAQLPKVEALFKDVATAVVHLGEAAAPLGGVVLQALDGIAQAISRIPVPVLTALIVALDVGRLASIVRGLSGVGSALGAIGISAGIANPILLGLTVVVGAFAVAAGQSAAFQAKLAQATNDVTAALQASNGVFDDAVKKKLAVTAADTGALDSLDKLGLSQKDYFDALSGGQAAQDHEIIAIRDAAAAKGLSKAATIQLLGPLAQQVNSVQDGTDKWNAEAKAMATATVGLDAGSIAIAKQKQFLDANNLTVDTATKKYNDAVAAAHTFDAELGYMTKALQQQSGNLITATLGQDALNLSMGTSADRFAASRAQVAAHGKSLEGNTADTISNRDWALQQIQAINQQAISQAQATGSIKAGTDSLKTNEAALRTSMYQAGFTKAQVDKLIATYEATPSKISTSIEEQGSQAVLAALGDILNQLHAIADPVWGAKFDFAMNNPSLKRGFARGGPVTGPGSGTSDSIPAWLSSGEYVVNAAATQKHLGLLENINRQKYAGGGLVGNLDINTMGLASEWTQYGRVLAGALTDAATRAAAQIAKQAAQAGGVPGVSGPASAGVAALQAYALSLFRYYNWPSSEMSSLISLWNGESGWSPAAYNASSGATGIPQSLPASKMASAGADYLTNGNTQIRWGENYIHDVYGSPSAAYSAWLSRSPHWYGGGLGPTTFTHPTMIGVGERGPETVSITPGRYGGSGVVVAPGAITVYAAAGMDAREVARQAFVELRRWVADEERRAAKGGRA